MRLNLLFCAMLALMPVAATMPASAAPAAGDKAFERAANAAVDRVAREDGFSGTILVARGDRVLLRRAAGFADRERKIPNTPDTKFPLESITKQFTAAAILLLGEDGKIALPDPIAKYYPNIPAAWRAITVAELLTHSSGIDDCIDCTAKDGTFEGIHSRAGILSIAAKKNLAFAPGGNFLYSNAGYALLTAAVERASGESYAQFMRRRVFDPLGLHDTGSGPIPGDVVKGYIRSRSSGREVWQTGQIENLARMGGFGSIYSTLDDMLAWNLALQSNKLLSAVSRKAMFTDYGHNYGFGWRFATKFGRQLIWHTGAYPTAGHASLLDSFPQEHLTVVALTNNTGLTDATATLTIGGKLTTFPANATRKLVEDVESLYFTGASSLQHRQSRLSTSLGSS